MQESKDQDMKEKSFDYLYAALKVNFVPAMIAAASYFRHIPQLQERSLELICKAADKYHAPSAELHLGLMYLNVPDCKDRALEYIEKASREPQLPLASVILALHLSPISDMEYSKKDSKRAVELFERSLKVERHPIALHELAMLLYNGIGCEKDVERANKLQQECIRIDTNPPPPLEVRDESYVPKKHEPQHKECCCDCKCEHKH